MNENGKTILKICIPIILLSLFVACSLSDIEIKKARAEFETSVRDSLSIYGDQITKVYIQNGYVCVYVDARRWNNTDAATQNAFMKEVYSLVRIDAITSGILKSYSGTLSFYDSNNNRIALYMIKE